MLKILQMKKISNFIIRGYQLTFSSLVGNCCRFQPTCSEYARQAFQKYGCIKGGYLTIKRLLRCHPGCQGGYDPLP